jgi:hypothetical protein
MVTLTKASDPVRQEVGVQALAKKFQVHFHDGCRESGTF